MLFKDKVNLGISSVILITPHKYAEYIFSLCRILKQVKRKFCDELSVFFLPKYVLLQCGTYTILPDLERKIIDRDFRS